MQKLIIFLLFVFSAPSIFGQNLFKEAYFVNKKQDTIHGLIKDYDWNFNPNYFIFKKDENSVEQKIFPENVLLFEIFNASKYKSSLVQIDVSEHRIEKLSKEKPANFESKHLFLKTLVEGEANLYKFSSDKLVRYFIETSESGIEQLVYKKYVNNNSEILENNRFRQQLLLKLDCENLKKHSLKNIKYRQKTLVKLVSNYNSCFEVSTKNYVVKKPKKTFFFSINPGLQKASLSTESGRNVKSKTEFDAEYTFRLGLEVEYILPFNNKKWSLIFEPAYQYYSSRVSVEPDFLDSYREVDYQSIELNFGVRYYMFLNKSQPIFINLGLSQDIDFNSEITGNIDAILDVKSALNPLVGAGFKFNKTMSLELRYQINRDLLTKYVSRNSDYRSLALIFSYRFM